MNQSREMPAGMIGLARPPPLSAAFPGGTEDRRRRGAGPAAPVPAPRTPHPLPSPLFRLGNVLPFLGKLDLGVASTRSKRPEHHQSVIREPVSYQRISIPGDLPMNEALRKTLKQLRLSGLLESLEIRLQEAAGHGLNHSEFLELILQDELAVRADRQFQRRFKAAEFRERKSLEDFDWSFNPSLPRKQVYDLASCRFLREGRDVLWLGPPGLGKSHLVQAIGYQAVKAGYTVLYRSIFDLVRDFLHDEVLGQDDKMLTKYLKPELLIIDDMGMKQLPRRSGECLFEVVMRRYETRSTMMTSNRPLEDWGKLLGDVPSATAILDRFLHHAELVRLTGRSYRLRHQSATESEESADPKPAKAPTGSDGEQPGSKPAKAPTGSDGKQPGSTPAKAPTGSQADRKGPGTMQKRR
jgi:DNA replication protein DnaC